MDMMAATGNRLGLNFSTLGDLWFVKALGGLIQQAEGLGARLTGPEKDRYQALLRLTNEIGKQTLAYAAVEGLGAKPDGPKPSINQAFRTVFEISNADLPRDQMSPLPGLRTVFNNDLAQRVGAISVLELVGESLNKSIGPRLKAGMKLDDSVEEDKVLAPLPGESGILVPSPIEGRYYRHQFMGAEFAAAVVLRAHSEGLLRAPVQPHPRAIVRDRDGGSGGSLRKDYT